MYARFLFALAIAASIFTISAVSRAAIASQTSVINVQALSRAAIASADRAGTVRLPTVVVRPDAKAQRALAQADAAEAEASIAVAHAHNMLAGARSRVAKVSMLIPYYSFGGASARGVE
jgi:hypothetical protein